MPKKTDSVWKRPHSIKQIETGYAVHKSGQMQICLKLTGCCGAEATYILTKEQADDLARYMTTLSASLDTVQPAAGTIQ